MKVHAEKTTPSSICARVSRRRGGTAAEQRITRRNGERRTDSGAPDRTAVIGEGNGSPLQSQEAFADAVRQAEAGPARSRTRPLGGRAGRKERRHEAAARAGQAGAGGSRAGE